MSPITDDEQVDELKERRRARESRPGSKRETAVRIPSAEPARDLLGGLITTGAPENGEESSASAHHAAPAPAPEALSESDAREEEAGSTGPVGGEKIDELIRRVKEGTPADADVATTIQQRRPKGTADLPPSPAARRAHRRPRSTARSRRHAARPRTTRLLGIVATVVVAGSAVLVVALNGSSGRLSPARSDSSPTSSAGPFATFGGALRSTIAALGPELRPLAQRVVSTERTSRSRRTTARRRPTRSHTTIKHRVQRHPRQPTRAVASSSPSTTATTVQTQTYAPASPVTSTPSQSSAPATHSTTSSTHPSGPTGSNPLGGIGSCVTGC
jgi:hypothetical protein